MEEKRLGLAVWVRNIKAAKNLRKFGNVHYISRRLQYVSMYVDAKNIEHTIDRIRKLNFVTRVEPSHRHEIPTEYSNSRTESIKVQESVVAEVQAESVVLESK